MDISELIANIPQIGYEFLTSYCIINGMPMRLDELQNMGYEEFWQHSKLNMPKKLYKYFPNTVERDENGLVVKDENGIPINYSLINLQNNTVFMQTPSAFDDVYDSDIHIEFEDYAKLRLREYCERSEIKISDGSTVQEMGNALLQHLLEAYNADKGFLGAFSRSDSTELERLSNEILCKRTVRNANEGTDLGIALAEAIREEYDQFCDQLKTAFRISCFATSPYSQLMWGGTYANNHKGFCIEYTVLPNEKDYEEVFHNLFPVVYCKIRPDMTKRLVDYKDKAPTLENLWDIYLHGALRKSIDWAYQNEWRLLLPLGRNKETNYNIPFFPITKVYLGNRMNAENRNKIIDICKERGIPYVGVKRSQDYFEMQDCEQLCENCPKVTNAKK